MARPTKLTDAVREEITLRLADGESLSSICRDSHMPIKATVLLWVGDDRDGFYTDYVRAREAQGHVQAEHITRLAQSVEQEQVSPNAAKVAIDAYKWAAERMAPNHYSPKTISDHRSSDGSMSPQAQITDEDLDRRIRELTGDK